ncbi:mucin-5AC-like [Amia ocellicauda]|uniref:mucin-5AC-like n=1 Tax=Amia ocellicauda TaxID=2972642 RepID=UPI00346468E7
MTSSATTTTTIASSAKPAVLPTDLGSTANPTGAATIISTTSPINKSLRNSVVAVLRLEFNNSNPAANETAVLNAFTDLLAPYKAQGIYPVNATKITYQKTTGNAFAVTVDFRIDNLTVPEGSNLTNQTFSNIQDPINALFRDILTNYLGGEPASIPAANFTKTDAQVQAAVVYKVQSSALQNPNDKLKKILNITGPVQDLTATLSINGQPPSPTAAPTTAITTAVPTSSVIAVLRLEFNSSNPAPNETAVLNAFTDLLAPYKAQGIYPVNATKITYQKTTGNAFAVTVDFRIDNLTVPEGSNLTNQTFSNIQDPINALFRDILTNYLGGEPASIPAANFTKTDAQVQAAVVYKVQSSALQNPNDKLKKILNITGPVQDLTATLSINGQPPSPTAAPTTAITTAVPTSSVIAVLRLEFNSSNPAPNETAVLNAFTDLLAPYKAQGIYPVNATKITYQKTTGNAFAVTVDFRIDNLTVPEGSNLTNQTFSNIQDPINALFRDILTNYLGGEPASIPAANFTKTDAQVQAAVVYKVQSSALQNPNDKLKKILNITGPVQDLTATLSINGQPPSPTAAPTTAITTAVPTSSVIAVLRLEFNSSNPAPNETAVLNAFTDLLAPYKAQGIYPVNATKITYQKTTGNAFAVTVDFRIDNLTVPEGSNLTNQTFSNIQDPINALFRDILTNYLGGEPASIPAANFTKTDAQVQAAVVYKVQSSALQNPNDKLKKILNITGPVQDLTATLSINGQPPSPTAAPTTAITTAVPTSSVIAVLRLEFNSSNPAPNETAVLNAFTDLLAPYKAQGIYPVNATKITYQKTTGNAFAVTVDFRIDNLTVPEGSNLTNQTFSNIQDPINALFRDILTNYLGGEPASIPAANFTKTDAQVQAAVVYKVQSSALQNPNDKLKKILNITGPVQDLTATLSINGQPPSPTAAPTTAITTAVPTSSVIAVLRLEFNSSNPAPNETAVLNAFTDLLAPYKAQGIYPVNATKITYQKTTGNAFAVTVDFRIDNLTVPEGSNLTNQTFSNIQDPINALFRDILTNYLGGEPASIPAANFTYV